MATIDEILARLIDFTYHPYKSLYGDLRKIYKAEALRMALARAEKRGWLEKKLDNEEIHLKLTQLGGDILKKRRPIRKLLPWQSEGEGKICVVVFDIPEKNRAVRDLFRSKLKEAGMVGWQRSVWVGKNVDIEGLRDFLKEIDLEKHVLVFETESVGNDQLEKLLDSLR